MSRCASARSDLGGASVGAHLAAVASAARQVRGVSLAGVPGADSCGRPWEWRSGELAPSTRHKRLGDMGLRPKSEFATRPPEWRTRPELFAPLAPPAPPVEML